MRFSLGRKIRTIIVIIVLVCSVAYMALSFYMIQRAVTVQMKNDGQTLITTIKRELIKNNVTELTGMQEIFKEIKEASNGNISYVSLSDANSSVFLTDDKIFGQTEEVDGVSSATVGGDKVTPLSKEEVSGNILKMPDGTKVYNITTGFQYNGESGYLNLGISLDTMYDEVRIAFFDMAVIGIIIMAVSVLVAVIPTGKIIKPILSMSENLKLYAKGDFRRQTEAHSKDELGDMSKALDNMRLNMVQLVSGIKDNSIQVLDSVNSLNSAMEESSLSAMEISKVSEELTAGTADLADNSQTGLSKMNLLADSVNSLYVSLDVIQRSIEQIKTASLNGNRCQKELHEQVSDNGAVFVQMKGTVDDLAGKLGSIVNMTSVIRAIADQTNLLAVNARIESARAGEQGKGFAVVAQEIAKLAEQTTQSIEGIENLSKEVEESFTRTVEIMDRGASTVKDTTTASNEAGEAFELIEKAIHDVITHINSVATDIKKVHTGKEDAIHLMENISSVAQQSSAATEEIACSLECQNEGIANIARSTKLLQEISRELSRLIDKFEL